VEIANLDMFAQEELIEQTQQELSDSTQLLHQPTTSLDLAQLVTTAHKQAHTQFHAEKVPIKIRLDRQPVKTAQLEDIVMKLEFIRQHYLIQNNVPLVTSVLEELKSKNQSEQLIAEAFVLQENIVLSELQLNFPAQEDIMTREKESVSA